MTITLEDGSKITDELALADAHPDGARPFVRDNYKQKFLTLSEGGLLLSSSASSRLPKVWLI